MTTACCDALMQLVYHAPPGSASCQIRPTFDAYLQHPGRCVLAYFRLMPNRAWPLLPQHGLDVASCGDAYCWLLWLLVPVDRVKSIPLWAQKFGSRQGCSLMCAGTTQCLPKLTKTLSLQDATWQYAAIRSRRSTITPARAKWKPRTRKSQCSCASGCAELPEMILFQR